MNKEKDYFDEELDNQIKNLIMLNPSEDLEDKVAEIEDDFFDKADQIEEREIRLEKNDIIISNHVVLWKLV